jgi:hypothetical protein
MALTTRGYVLLTLKAGEGGGIDRDGRKFYYWQDARLREHFHRYALTRVEFFQQASLVDPADVWLTYLLKKMA